MAREDVELHHREKYVKIDTTMQNHPPASIIQDFNQVNFLVFLVIEFWDIILGSS